MKREDALKLSPRIRIETASVKGSIALKGARIDDIDLPALADTAALQRHGGFSAAESWAWHRQRLATHEAQYDPRVVLRIRRGEAISAADYIDLLAERRAWIARIESALRGYDALLSPTLPVVAPRIQPLIDSDEAFFATNAQLLRNPALVNLLDGCALSLPCQREGEWPVGLMAWGPQGADDRVLGVSLAIEQVLRGDA
jgi:amidase/aspartyl-tRNA(Asn)/glutamyl-tRNA(Gln) amidotransferase subunit A